MNKDELCLLSLLVVIWTIALVVFTFILINLEEPPVFDTGYSTHYKQNK